MHIFLSYARPDAQIVEQVHAALSLNGHRVFFDKQRLAGGDEFHAGIREEIEKCDLFVFFASTASLRAESYALNELELASRRLLQARQSRLLRSSFKILPFRLDDWPIDQAPALLKQIVVLQPTGNRVAFIVAEIERSRGSTHSRFLAFAFVLVLAAGTFGVYELVTKLGNRNSDATDGAQISPAPDVPEVKIEGDSFPDAAPPKPKDRCFFSIPKGGVTPGYQCAAGKPLEHTGAEAAVLKYRHAKELESCATTIFYDCVE